MKMEASLPLEEAAARSWQAVVVGAGPAGAMAALELARLGTAVLLVEQASFPRFKVCGCCLNAWGQATLAEAGLGGVAERLGGVPLTRFCLACFGRRLDLILPHLLALSREALDAALVRAALDAGAHFLPETQARLEPPDPGCRRVMLRRGGQSAEVSTQWVLAADGLAGRLVAAEPEGTVEIAPDSRLGAGVVVEAPDAPYAPGVIYMGCAARGYVGLVRLADGRLNAGAALDPEAVRTLGGLGAAAATMLRTSGLPPVEGLECAAWKGTPPLTRRLQAPSGERWLALGDAAGYVEPFTGEGMAWALAQGRAVAPLAAGEWTPARGRVWRAVYHTLMDARQRRCRRVAEALRHPLFAGGLAGAAALFPRLAAPVVRRFTMARS